MQVGANIDLREISTKKEIPMTFASTKRFFNIVALYCSVALIACTSEGTGSARLQSESEIHDGELLIKAVRLNNGDVDTLDVEVSNFTDGGVALLICDVSGFDNGVQTATISRQLLFRNADGTTRGSGLLPGESRPWQFVFSDPESINVTSASWNCTYELVLLAPGSNPQELEISGST